MMYSKGKDALKPLVFAVIERLTPKEHELVFYDERIENVPQALDADIIAFSVKDRSLSKSPSSINPISESATNNKSS